MLQSVVPDLYKQAWHPFLNICITVMSKQAHQTLPRVRRIHATNAALKLSLFCVGSITSIWASWHAFWVQRHRIISSDFKGLNSCPEERSWGALICHMKILICHLEILISPWLQLLASSSSRHSWLCYRKKEAPRLLAVPWPNSCMSWWYNGLGKGSSWLLPLEVMVGWAGGMVGMSVFSSQISLSNQPSMWLQESFCQTCGRQP